MKKKPRGRPFLGNVNRHVVLEPDLYELLRRQAEEENRQFSNMLNVIIREGFEARAGADA